MTLTDPLHQHVDWAQMARYLGGELPPADARAFERWFERDDDTRRLFAEARAAWAASAPPQGQWDVEAGVRRLRQAAAAGQVTAEAPMSPPLLSRPIRQSAPRHVPTFAWPKKQWRSAALAAALAALVVSGALLWSWRQGVGRTGGSVLAAMTEVTTPRGQRAVVLLPDGSRVTLSVASRLWYPRNFGVDSRVVRLDGEAYFEVVHDEARPFRVRAGAGEFEDVGTAFVVRAYGGSEGTAARVVVAEGAVLARRIADPNEHVVLTATELARVDGGGITHESGVSVARYIAWMHGDLTFDDATLSTVAEELSRWYDIDVHADPMVATRRFTGSFDRRVHTMETVARAVAAAADVTIERTANGVRFR